jgi:hypothetical protein
MKKNKGDIVITIELPDGSKAYDDFAFVVDVLKGINDAFKEIGKKKAKKLLKNKKRA